MSRKLSKNFMNILLKNLKIYNNNGSGLLKNWMNNSNINLKRRPNWAWTNCLKRLLEMRKLKLILH